MRRLSTILLWDHQAILNWIAQQKEISGEA